MLSAPRRVAKCSSQPTFLGLLILLLALSRGVLILLRLLAVQLADIVNFALALALAGGGWPFALVHHL